MFIVDRSLPAGPRLGLQVEPCLTHGQERGVVVLAIEQPGLVRARNHALEQTAGLVERPLRIHDLIVEVNGEQTIHGILEKLRNVEELRLCMRIRRPWQLSLLEAEHLAADRTYWMQQCKNWHITYEWEEMRHCPWNDDLWRGYGRAAFYEVKQFVHVAFTWNNLKHPRFEDIAKMPDFVQRVFNSDLNRDRMEHDAHPNHRNLAQLGDGILLTNLISAVNILRADWRPEERNWQSFCQGGFGSPCRCSGCTG